MHEADGFRTIPPWTRAAALALLGVACAQAHAQITTATIKPDGQWHAALGAGFTNSTGNTTARTITFNGDAAHTTERNKWTFYGNALDARSNGSRTGQQIRAGTRFDYNFAPRWFSFVGADGEHDRIAQLKLRLAANSGVGYKFVDTPDNTFDVFGGLGYTRDRYDTALVVDGAARTNYSYFSGVLGEESTHKFTPTVSAKQKFTLLPTLNGSGIYRATFDAGLSVALTRTMSLNVAYNARHNSEPGPGIKKTDTLLTTGVTVKFD